MQRLLDRCRPGQVDRRGGHAADDASAGRCVCDSDGPCGLPAGARAEGQCDGPARGAGHHDLHARPLGLAGGQPRFDAAVVDHSSDVLFSAVGVDFLVNPITSLVPINLGRFHFLHPLLYN